MLQSVFCNSMHWQVLWTPQTPKFDPAIEILLAVVSENWMPAVTENAHKNVFC